MSAAVRFFVLALVTSSCLAAATAVAGFWGTDVFLPMVGRNAGIHPSNWYTKVWVYNPNASAVDITVYLLQRSTSNPNPPFYTDTIQAGDTMLYENAVFTLFGVEVYGAMRVVSTNKVVVSSRVYSQATGADEEDSVGQFFAGVPASFAIGLGETSEILGVHQTQPSGDSEFRYNFGFVETTGSNVTVRVTVYDETGVQEGEKDFQVREYSQRQVAFKDHFPGVSTENSRLTVEVVAGDGKIIAYGSGIANGSQDPSTFEMTYPQAGIVTDATLTGDGTVASPLGLADGAVTLDKLGTTNTPSSPTSLGAEALAATPVTVLSSDGTNLSWSTAGTGDITGVVAGDGLTGGGVEDDVELAVGAGPGIEVQANYVTIASAGVTAGMIGNGAVTGAALADGSVSTNKLQDAAVTTAKLAGNAVTTANIADSSVGSAKIIDESIGPQDISDGGVTSAEILDGSVATADLAEGAVTKQKLSAPGGTAGQVLTWDGSSLMWTNDGVTLPFEASVNSSGALARLSNLGTGHGVAVSSAEGSSSCAISGAKGAWGPPPTGGAAVAAYGNASMGVYGRSTGTFGVVGESDHFWGVYGWSRDSYGVSARSNNGTAIWAYGDNGIGVHGQSPSSDGVYGESTSGYGVHGKRGSFHGYLGYSDGGVLGSNGTNYGYLGRANEGVLGQALNHGGIGVRGESSNGEGVYGTSGGLYAGVHGFSVNRAGVWGESTNDAGVYGTSSNGWAGYFIGKLRNSNLAGGGSKGVCADSLGVLTVCPSDARLKKDVLPLTEEIDVLTSLAELRGVTFNWDTSTEWAEDLGDKREMGMVAQEVEPVLPHVVGESTDGYRSLDYAKLTAFLIEVAKAQQVQISEQEARIQTLEETLAGLAAQ